jgi:hypothetical protein
MIIDINNTAIKIEGMDKLNTKQKDFTVLELAAIAHLDGSRIRQLLLNGTLKGIKRTAYFWLIPYDEAVRWLKEDRNITLDDA